MIRKTRTYFMGYRLLIDQGVNLKPRWYDLPRRLGFRKPYRHYTTPKGAVILGNEGNPDRFMTVRDEDHNALINSNIPGISPHDNLVNLAG